MPNEPVLSLVFSQDSKTLAIGSIGVSILEFKDGDWVNPVDRLSGVFWTTGSDYGPYLGPLIDNFPPQSQFSGGWVPSMTFNTDGRILVTGGVDGQVRLWDLSSSNSSESMLNRYQAHEGVVRSVVFSHRRQLIVTAGDDMVIRLKSPGSACW